MRLRRVQAAAALAIGLALGPLAVAAPAHAEDPVVLGTTHVVDKAHVLTEADTDRIQSAVSALARNHRIDLYVVYVGRFTNPEDVTDWANDTAALNSLGTTQYLLAISVADHTYDLSGDDAGPVTPSQVNQIEADDVAPRVQAGDWTGAGVGAATGLGNALGSAATAVAWAVGIGVVAVAALVVLLVLLRRRARRRGQDGAGAPLGAPGDTAIDDLEVRASAALVATDDAVRTSAGELAWATAESGPEALRPLRSALENAGKRLRDAFALARTLDDPGLPDHERRDACLRILQLCKTADLTLDAQTEAIDERRALELRIPEAIRERQARLDALAPRVEAAQEALGRMGELYRDASLATVRDNPEQARARLAFAGETLAAAARRLDAADPAGAVAAIRASEEAIDQAELLATAVGSVQAHREAAGRSAALATASARVAECEDYVAARRGAVGARARILLADARRLVASAAKTAQTDPEAAQRLTERAGDTATEATEAAIRDVAAFGSEDGAAVGGILVGSESVSFGGSGTRARRGGGF